MDIDKSAFYKMSYGLYLLATKSGERGKRLHHRCGNTVRLRAEVHHHFLHQRQFNAGND